MMRFKELKHCFVRSIPRELDPGVLYISLDYGTAVHSCCCGCGEQVVTPFSPTDWKMIYDGVSVSLMPSIGNWNLVCRSHYIIKQGCVIEANSWSDAQVAAERRRDKTAKANYYDTTESSNTEKDSQPGGQVHEAPESVRHTRRDGRFWSSLGAWLRGARSED